MISNIYSSYSSFFDERKDELKPYRNFSYIKKGGYILIYVWAYEQDKFKNYEKNAMVEWNNQKNNETLKRYYYLFSRYELDDLVSNFDNIKYKKGNNVLIII